MPLGMRAWWDTTRRRDPKKATHSQLVARTPKFLAALAPRFCWYKELIREPYVSSTSRVPSVEPSSTDRGARITKTDAIPKHVFFTSASFVASLGDGVELRVSFQCGIRTNDEKSPKYVISTIYSAFDSTITLSGLPSGQFQPRRSEVWLRAPLQVRTLLRRTTTIQEWRGSPCDE
jgi:hypothetical protein